MPAAAATLLALAGLRAAHGLQAWNPQYLVSGDNVQPSFFAFSKPGTPKVSDWMERPVINNSEPWRVELADRVVRAASAHDTMEKCGSFLSFGDYTWCMKAMPPESTPEFKKIYKGIAEFVVSRNVTKPPTSPDGLLGMSFGIRTSDAWSELMSSMFLVKTELFDCYFDGDEGPLAKNMHEGYSKDKPCMERRCYTTEYTSRDVCNDDTTDSKSLFTANKKNYIPLSAALEGRGNLSTFIKMDVEGSEWATLKRLLENEGDMAKIRTLDLELHFNYDATPEGNRPITRDTLTRHVEIMEMLAKKFAVTGSSIETYLKDCIMGYTDQRQKNPEYMDKGQAELYTKGGLILNQYTISYVNRELL